MNEYVNISGLLVAQPLYDFMEQQASQGKDADFVAFWRSLSEAVQASLSANHSTPPVGGGNDEEKMNQGWASLYDALYTSAVIPQVDGRDSGPELNPVRATAVITLATDLLDRLVPLTDAFHADVRNYRQVDFDTHNGLSAVLADGSVTGLRNPGDFSRFVSEDGVSRITLVGHGVHVELHVDAKHAMGLHHPAGVKDIRIAFSLSGE